MRATALAQRGRGSCTKIKIALLRKKKKEIIITKMEKPAKGKVQLVIRQLKKKPQNKWMKCSATSAYCSSNNKQWTLDIQFIKAAAKHISRERARDKETAPVKELKMKTNGWAVVEVFFVALLGQLPDIFVVSFLPRCRRNWTTTTATAAFILWT